MSTAKKTITKPTAQKPAERQHMAKTAKAPVVPAKKKLAPVPAPEPEMTEEDLEILEAEEVEETEEVEAEEVEEEVETEEEEEAPAPEVPSQKKKTQAVTVKAQTAISTESKTQAAPSNVLKNDVLIPRLLLMQGQSDLVKARKAQQGDIVRSTNAERMGGITQPGTPSDAIEIIPLAMSNSWTVVATDGNRWVRSEPRTNQNDSLPWQFEEDGEELKRLKTIDLIAILPSDIRRASGGEVQVDDDGIPDDLDAAMVLPVAISFRSTGFTAGKSVATFFAKVTALQKTHPKTRPYHFSLSLSCFEDKNDSGSFYVFDVGHSKKTDKDLLGEASQWYEQVTAGTVKVEEEGEAEQKATEAFKTTKPAATAPKTGARKAQF